MKFLRHFTKLFLIFLLFAVSGNGSEKKDAGDGIIHLVITKNSENNVEAKITNLTEEAKKLSLDKILISGKSVTKPSIKDGKPTTSIEWSKVSLQNKSADLPSPYQSKLVTPSLSMGDNFKAKGDPKSLLTAVNNLVKDSVIVSERAASSSSTKRLSSSISTSTENVSSASSGSSTSRLSTLSSQRQSAASVASKETGTESTTSTGCAVRVDYQLNKVFKQERTTIDGKEVSACKDSATSFALQKDYQVCPKNLDTISQKIYTYFQYFYNDTPNSTAIVDACQVDSTKTAALRINKSYTCSDYIDFSGKIVYQQFKQSYEDIDGKEVLLTDCAVDSSRSYSLVEDSSSCGLRNLFDLGYSIAQSRFYYVKDGTQIVVQPCQDTTTRYTHNSTSETCTPIINSGQVTLFSRKYITVNGTRQYISDCTPISSNVTIRSENCTTTPYTHDFTANVSYRNKNYYYTDNTGNRVDVSSCVRSEESFQQAEDSSVCSDQNDDVNMRTTVSVKKYITVDGNRVYITNCTALATPVPYREIGYKWSTDLNVGSTTLAVAGVVDSSFIGSKQGVEQSIITYDTSSNYKDIGETRLSGQYNINGYSTVGKCRTPSSYSYNGNAIDLAYSNQSSIAFDNFVEQVTQPAACYNLCMSYSLFSTGAINRCTSMVRQCENVSNTLYYQRCTNYRCGVYKLVKKPIMQRRNGTEIIDNSRVLETKYTCGDSGLNGVTSYYP